jgi:hypothetical protein
VKLIPSLQMVVEVVDDVWTVMAPWLAEPVSASTFEAAYWLAMRQSR